MRVGQRLPDDRFLVSYSSSLHLGSFVGHQIGAYFDCFLNVGLSLLQLPD